MAERQPRAILFDLDETLIPETQPLADAYRAVATAVWGADASDAQIAALRRAARTFWETYAPCPGYRERVHVGPSDGLSSEFVGTGDERAQLREFLSCYRAHVFDAALPAPSDGGSSQLRDVWWEARIADPRVFPGARELLEGLRGAYRLALITNGSSDFQRHKVASSGLGGYFDALIVSSDLGTGKPHPEPFLAALAALETDPADAVMIGNDKVRDIAGAQGLGIRTIWVQPGDPSQPGAVTELSAIPALLGA